MSRCVYFFLYVCHITFSRPLIGQKKESYILEEVIEVDDLDKGNISAVAENKRNNGMNVICVPLRT